MQKAFEQRRREAAEVADRAKQTVSTDQD